MSKVLVVVAGENGVIAKSSLAALTAGFEIVAAHKLSAVVVGALGSTAATISGAALAFGASAAFHCDQPELDSGTASAAAEAIEALAKAADASVIVLPATSFGKDVAPRVATKLGAAQASDITAVLADGFFVRPMYAGNIFAEVELTTAKKVITVRPTGFVPAVSKGAAGTSSAVSVSFSDLAKKVSLVKQEKSGGSRPQLGDAPIVVSGGQALKSSDNFSQIIFPLADVLNAAVGASRAAVDAGYAPNDWQVGQTGKVVAPQLYIAVGISGAIQHLAGMKDSKVIVAINKDPDAPIFEVADYGLVADLYTAVPELTAAIKASK